MAVPDDVVVTLVPPPPPSSWVALAALALGHALRDFFDLMLCFCFANLWLGCAGSALAILPPRACGGGGGGAGAGSVTLQTMALDASTRGRRLGRALPYLLIGRLLVLEVMGYRFKISRDLDHKSAVEIVGMLYPWFVVLGLMTTTSFFQQAIWGRLLVSSASASGLQELERLGAVIEEVAILGALATTCFLILPALARFAWRMKMLVAC